MVHMSITRPAVSRRNENGGVSMNGPAVGAISRKWKRRNVSAVRDFPPGCGPFVQPVSVVVVKEAEAALSLGNDNNVETQVVEDQAASKEEVSGMVNDVVKVDDVKLLSPTHGVDNSVVKEDVTKVKSRVVENQAGSKEEVSGIVNNGVVKEDVTKVKSRVVENQAASKEEVSGMVNDVVKVDVDDVKLLSPTHDNGLVKEDVSKVKSRVVENQAGSNEEVSGMVNDVVRVDDVKLLSPTHGVDNGVVKEDVTKVKSRVVENQVVSKEEVSGMVNDVVRVDDVKLLSPTHGVDNGVVKEDVTKVKFPRRRVSAVRDFPPFCGYNAGEPSEEERERITGRRRSDTGDKGGGEGRNVKVAEAKVAGGDGSNVSLKEDLLKKRKSDDLSIEGAVTNQEAEMLMAGEESDINVENEKVEKVVRDVTGVERGKRVHNIGQACQELVVYTRDQVVMRRCSDDEDSGEDKFQDERIKSHEMREKVSMTVNRSFSGVQRDIKSIPFRSEGYERFLKKRPLDDTNDLRFDGDRLRVVLGLKAPSLGAPGSLKKDLTIKEKGSQASLMPKSFTNKKPKNKDVWGQSSSTRKVGYTGTLEMVREEDDFAADAEEQGAALKCVIGLKAPSLCAPGNPGQYYTTKAKGNQASTIPNNSTKKKQKSQEKAVRRVESSSTGKVAYTGTLEMVVRKDDFDADTKEQDEYRNSQGTRDTEVSVPPFGPKSSNDARNKVREILRLYQAICRKILQGEEAKTNELTSGAPPVRRVDLEAKKILDQKGRALDLGPKTYGPVAGVEVGDEFLYRVELALVGLHRPFQGGIDYVKLGKELFAVSVVASGGYDDETDNPNRLVYSGSGGVTKDKIFEDQKLERGNLALKNNIDARYPVRVIRGYKGTAESVDSKPKAMITYIYDGLYTVDECKQVPGQNGFMVFKFELNRIPGQPELAIREMKSKKFKKREGICVNDISNGKEVFPICAVNTIDDEKPPSFTYITKIVYPNWYQPVLPKGCDCVGRCTDKKCSCAFKNGGEIPYNHNGAIVEAKPLVYECGPSCRCPPSCYNRVTQHRMKIRLEIFKTESRGWGVRSLSSISSGSFICEYIGELLEDTEAEKRTSNDEYLFDIGQNYSDCYPNPEMKSDEIVCSEGFTIDAFNYGNVGRFINHSCSPNLYAQNVLYDQEDKRMPHIMLFAAENIPPLQELTYHYNYKVDMVRDSDGNIKVKNCYCGSSECTGRLY